MQMNNKLVKNIAEAIMDDMRIKYNSMREEYLASEEFQLRISTILLTDTYVQERKKRLEEIEKLYKFLSKFDRNSLDLRVYTGCFVITKEELENEELFYTSFNDESESILNYATNHAKEQLGLIDWCDNKLSYIERKVIAIVSTLESPSYKNAVEVVMGQIDIYSIIIDPKI